ncbi:heavy metal-binding domain-containing protein [Rhodopirellula europaea]|uniref:heavy metal-binding domain-containing protein n=1 Tax=Rhodopirellula europaea TaxID=1263866 RepID=UPI0030ECA4EC
MPWNCPACGGTTELGYNVCRKCGVARPGSVPDETNFRMEMPMTTTPTFETHTIEAYRGPVFGETIYGANAVIGIRFDYSTVGRSMLMICSSGTAVIANPRTPDTSR